MFKILSQRLMMAFAVMFLAMPSVMAAGEDDGLYDPVPPEGAVFVRFIHADPAVTGDVPPIINGKSRDGVKFGGIKPYSVVKHGKVNAQLGPGKVEFEAEKSAHYTLVLQNGELKIVKDPDPQDELKAQIIVYNFTQRDNISIKTADGKVSVIGPLKAGEVKDRAVNPIKVSFAVFSGEEKFADLTDWPLERGESYIIAITEDNGTGTANYDRARISEE